MASMHHIHVRDKSFRLLMDRAQIDAAVERVAAAVRRDLSGHCPLLLGVLDGSFVFAADLIRRLDFPCEISFIKWTSYSGMSSTGRINQLIGLDCNIRGRDVLIVEDLIDTGFTIKSLVDYLQTMEPASIRVAVSAFKPDSLKCDLKIDYVGMEVPSRFLLGYGLDYDGLGRQYPGLYILDDND